ncbi:hypothetical protein LTR95_008758 [Oleoguttula sp. CCFEE 5521]
MAPRCCKRQSKKPFPFFELPTELQAWIADLLVLEDRSIALLNAPEPRATPKVSGSNILSSARRPARSPPQTTSLVNPLRPFASSSCMMRASRATHGVYRDAVWRRILQPDLKIGVVIKDLQFGSIIALFDAWAVTPSIRPDLLRGKLLEPSSLNCHLAYNERILRVDMVPAYGDEMTDHRRVAAKAAIAAERWVEPAMQHLGRRLDDF